MTVVSKLLFHEKIGKEVQCCNIHYWNESCLKGNLWFSGLVFLGSLKFFLPIYIVKAIINHKKFKSKTFWQKLLLEELRSGFYGVLLATSFISTNCLLCKLSGRLNYYNVGLISGFVSGLSVLIESKENHLLDTLIFFNMLVEAVFKNLDTYNILRLTKITETFLFMSVSSMLMYLLQNREKHVRYTNFWFYTPQPFQKNTDKTLKNITEYQCEHSKSCSNYVLSGAQKYFLLGYAFSIVRKAIPKMLTFVQKPSKLFGVLINKENVKFGTFIGAYVGIYRYIMCYLLKTKGLNQKYFGAIAGLISGAAYAISPSLQVLTLGITTIFQVFYNTIIRNLQLKNKLIPQQLVYMLSHGLLIHNAIMSRETCPAYYINMLDTCTSNTFSEIYNQIIGKYIL